MPSKRLQSLRCAPNSFGTQSALDDAAGCFANASRGAEVKLQFKWSSSWYGYIDHGLTTQLIHYERNFEAPSSNPQAVTN